MTKTTTNRRYLLLCSAAACLTLSGCVLFSRAPRTSSFSIIVLPDTQNYSLYRPDLFVAQTRWIAEQKDILNVACVVHEGDITQGNTEPEWRVADGAIRELDAAAVPYCITVGNHDLRDDESGRLRDARLFNRHFGPWRFEKKPWYGGHFGGGNENAFYLIHASGMDFLILCLEFGPRDEVLEWANKVVAKHKRRRTIIVTHCYMYSDDTRVGKGDSWNPHGYGCKGNDGEEMWDKFVRKHKNVFLVLSGHILNDGLGRRTDVADEGNSVHQLLANYQQWMNGGDGWLRIMRFLPAENRIIVTTYSPVLKQYATDAQNQFELEYRMD